MPDWKSSMQQTFEYYEVDPRTWKDIRKLDNVKSSTVSHDSETETICSATIDIVDSVGECYIRIYLVTIQNGVTEKRPLGTYLVQTPTSNFDGRSRTVTMDCYSPLLELKENPPPLGFYVAKHENVMDAAYRLVRDNVRAPVVKNESTTKLYNNFVANTDDTWLTFISDLAGYAKYYLDIDETGRILFAPKQDTASLQPVWTFDDSNSSILLPEMSIKHDIYGIPNVVEVLYSTSKGVHYSRVINNDSNSPTSTVNRGRELIYRDTDPSLTGDTSGAVIIANQSTTNAVIKVGADGVRQILYDDSDTLTPLNGSSSLEDGTRVYAYDQLHEYAVQLLRDLSTVEYQVSYSHGYCPVRVGDCVRLNYTRAGLNDIKAKVISQRIKCEPGCQVDEKAVFTNKLWR